MKRLLPGYRLTVALLLCLGCGGCVLSHPLVGRVLQAPNQQSTIPKEFENLAAKLGSNFVAQRVFVGPPPAALDLMVLEPGDYGANHTI